MKVSEFLFKIIKFIIIIETLEDDYVQDYLETLIFKGITKNNGVTNI